MELSAQEILLIDRIILNNSVSNTFIKNINERLNYGISHMNLDREAIEPIFCSTINKHTCTETLTSHPNKFFVIFDEHHFQLISAMNLLFYLFGKDDLTSPIFRFVMASIMSTPYKRLRLIAALLLSEKSLLSSNATQANAYLPELLQNKPTSDDFQGDKGNFELNLFLLKEKRARSANRIVMNYYVFHELAHIAYQHNSETIKTFMFSLQTILSNIDIFTSDISSISEEIVCDAYALNIIFNLEYETYHDFDYTNIVNSFVSAIINLTFMDSVIAHGNDINDWDILCWKRIEITLQLVGHQKENYEKYLNFSSHIQSCLEYCQMNHSNYEYELQSVILDFQNKYSNISEQFPIFSSQWITEKDNFLRIIASLS